MSTPLNEYDKDEWHDVCRILKPGITEDEFEELWAEFIQFKARRAQQ